MASSGGATESLNIGNFNFDLVGRQVGFDCEFVKKPSNIQSECPLCLLILREPYQVSCCGYSFCGVCIERIKAENKPCPTCKEEDFVTFHNRGLQRFLYAFQVYCSHKKEGCEWKGELGQLEGHLNLSPQPDNQLEGCEYSEIECICSELIKRSNITVHQNDFCPKRPFSCEYCHSYESHYKDVIHNHWPVCGYHPVKCPNKCGAIPQRQALETHVNTDCPYAVIDCNFHRIGCDVRLPRKDMAVHLKENLVTHMSLQAASYSKLLASHNELQAKVNIVEREKQALEGQLEASRQENQAVKQQLATLEKSSKAESDGVQDRMRNLEKESLQLASKTRMLSELQEKIDKLENSLNATQTLLESTQKEIQQEFKKSSALSNDVQKVSEFVFMPTLPNSRVEFTMENYSQLKHEGKDWFSPSFYTHNQGYKVCFQVIPNGSPGHFGKKYVSVAVYLMRGEFDAQLKWPFHGQITIELVDQGEKGEHYSGTIEFTDGTPYEQACRVAEGLRRNETGCVCSQFISQGELETKYLKDNCLQFRVSRIAF